MKENSENNRTGNWRQALAINLVDEIANDLVRKYGNPGYRKWYCKVIYELGPNRVVELQARAQDTKEPAKFFSRLASEEMRARLARKRLHG